MPSHGAVLRTAVLIQFLSLQVGRVPAPAPGHSETGTGSQLWSSQRGSVTGAEDWPFSCDLHWPALCPLPSLHLILLESRPRWAQPFVGVHIFASGKMTLADCLTPLCAAPVEPWVDYNEPELICLLALEPGKPKAEGLWLSELPC